MAYITYLTNLNQTNAYPTHPGYGETKEESQANATYYANQLPWVRTVPASKAPKWARRDAVTTRENELKTLCEFGFDSQGNERAPTKEELAEYEAFHLARIYS